MTVPHDTQGEIKVKGRKLGAVAFQVLWTIVSNESSELEVLSKIGQASASLKKLKPIWRGIILESKMKVMHSCHIHISACLCRLCQLN